MARARMQLYRGRPVVARRRSARQRPRRSRWPRAAAARVETERWSFDDLSSLEFDHDRCRRRIQDRTIEVQERAAFFERHLHLGAAVEMIRACDPVLDRRNRERRTWLVEKRHIQLARLRRISPLRVLQEERLTADVGRALRARLAKLVAKWRCAGAIHSLAIHAQPSPNRAQHVLTWLG